MNKKLLGWGFLVIIGLADAILNLWVFLLTRQTMALLQAAVGIGIVVVGVIRFQRERNQK